MYNYKKLNGCCMKSIFTIRQAIMGTELNHREVLEKSTPDERKRDRTFDEFLRISDCSNDSALKKLSPFFKYFEKKIIEFRKSMITNDSAGLSDNEFYSPPLFDILMGQLYLLPIWSGIMIHHKKIGYNIKSRISNNPVENWFGQLKKNILRDDEIVRVLNKLKRNILFFYYKLIVLKGMPSSICSKIYNTLQAKFLEYETIKELYSKKKKTDRINMEQWNKGNKRKRDGESFYYNNHDFIKMGKGMKYEVESVESKEFIDVFGTHVNHRKYIYHKNYMYHNFYLTFIIKVVFYI